MIPYFLNISGARRRRVFCPDIKRPALVGSLGSWGLAAVLLGSLQIAEDFGNPDLFAKNAIAKTALLSMNIFF